MTRPELKNESLSIVFLGKFNCSIIQPKWLAKEGILRESEGEAAKIEILIPQLAIFATQDFKVTANAERFKIETNLRSSFERTRDFALNIFDTLSHTPIDAIGLNSSFLYRFGSEKDWHAFGHKIAPKEHWKELKQPGLVSMTIQSKRPDDRKGYINVLIGAKPDYSIEVVVNDHFECSTPGEDHFGANDALEILRTEWDNSLERSKKWVDSLWS